MYRARYHGNDASPTSPSLEFREEVVWVDCALVRLMLPAGHTSTLEARYKGDSRGKCLFFRSVEAGHPISRRSRGKACRDLTQMRRHEIRKKKIEITVEKKGISAPRPLLMHLAEIDRRPSASLDRGPLLATQLQCGADALPDGHFRVIPGSSMACSGITV